jgi:hypothetical protein
VVEIAGLKKKLQKTHVGCALRHKYESVIEVTGVKLAVAAPPEAPMQARVRDPRDTSRTYPSAEPRNGAATTTSETEEFAIRSAIPSMGSRKHPSESKGFARQECDPRMGSRDAASEAKGFAR